jgi:hypothetical protein
MKVQPAFYIDPNSQVRAEFKGFREVAYDSDGRAWGRFSGGGDTDWTSIIGVIGNIAGTVLPAIGSALSPKPVPEYIPPPPPPPPTMNPILLVGLGLGGLLIVGGALVFVSKLGK